MRDLFQGLLTAAIGVDAEGILKKAGKEKPLHAVVINDGDMLGGSSHTIPSQYYKTYNLLFYSFCDKLFLRHGTAGPKGDAEPTRLTKRRLAPRVRSMSMPSVKCRFFAG